MAAIGRGVRAFGRFWWDFLVGDTPELLGAALVVVLLSFALRNDRVAATLAIPVVTALLLVVSALRGRAKATMARRAQDAAGPVA